MNTFIDSSGLEIGSSGLEIGSSGLEIGSSGLEIGSSGLEIGSSGSEQESYALALVDFTSASDELQASIYVTNQLLMTIIVILSLMFIRKILLSIKGRFYN